MEWIILGLQQGVKWRIILKDGQRVQVTEESQQMPVLKQRNIASSE